MGVKREVRRNQLQALIVATPLAFYAAAPALLCFGMVRGLPAPTWAKLILLNLALVGLYLLAWGRLANSETFLWVRTWVWRWLPPACYAAGAGVGVFTLVVS